MKIRVILGLAAMLVLAGPAFAQKVNIDYDSAYDFDTIKTFAWATTPETSVEGGNPLMHSRIVNAIEHYLSMGGMREVGEDDNPDIFVTYHTSTKEQMNLNTTSWGYGYPGGWYGGGWGGGWGGASMGTSSTTVSTYEVGTLVVDAWSPETKNLVWRGTAGNITVSPNPQKMEKKIDKALAKIVKKWQSMSAKKDKAAG